MGTYLGVNAVRAKGQKIGTISGTSQPHIPAGKRLIGIPNNGVWEIAPDLTHPSEYAAFYESYAGGHWLGVELYLLDEGRVAECPDEGRNYL